MKKLARLAVCLFMLASVAPCLAMCPVAGEIEFGKHAAAQFAKTAYFAPTPARVQVVFDRLTAHLNRPLPYRLRVIRDRVPNAFCIPGGHIYITTAMVKLAKSDDELAAVLAHELVHADRAHVVSMIEQGCQITMVALVAQLSASKEDVEEVLHQVYKAAANSSASHEMELEADRMSVDLLRSADFSPSASLSLLKSVASQYASVTGVTGTHPAMDLRIAAIEKAVSGN